MSKIRLEYEVLICGIYPFEGDFEKNGFRIIKNKLNESKFNDMCGEDIVYMSPFPGICCYPDDTGTQVYLTLKKNEYIELV